MSLRLVAESMTYLIRTELWLRTHSERPLYEILETVTPRGLCNPRHTPEELCRSMDIACLLYIKVVLCLQHSVAVALLLRKYGFPAELVIGTRLDLFKFHAWVVLNNQVVNDKPYISAIYRELARR